MNSLPTIFIEVCFVDTKSNADAYKKSFDKCCKAIAETLSGKKLKEQAKPVEMKSVLHKVQVGAFSDEKNATKLAAELKKKGYSVSIVKGFLFLIDCHFIILTILLNCVIIP
ncbi:SPOR domain-containing protein [Peribacillus frigoritolerans]|uniref:SPOR domain-containing protein n=1 Tax=Peribacillus frigoritolerans TaxID=450367 RepID=UPI002E205BF1|nr:SPOR domain-containing protein [Peribacillus frigoritolerans]